MRFDQQWNRQGEDQQIGCDVEYSVIDKMVVITRTLRCSIAKAVGQLLANPLKEGLLDGRILTVGDGDLPIPAHRLTPDTQEEYHDNDVAQHGISCDIFDRTVISRQSLTKSSSCQSTSAVSMPIRFK